MNHEDHTWEPVRKPNKIYMNSIHKKRRGLCNSCIYKEQHKRGMQLFP